MTTEALLQDIQNQVVTLVDTDHEFRIPRFYFVEVDHVWHVALYGDPAEEPFALVCEALTHPDVAPYLRSLSFTGPDVGANGTRNFDLTPLLSGTTDFARLTTFSVEGLSNLIMV